MNWMTLETMAQVGEFAGGLGVLVSLIYLALQIRGNARAQRAESYGRALDRIAAMQSRLGEDAEIGRIWNQGLVAPDKLDTEGRIRFVWLCTEMFGSFEFMYIQHRQGDLHRDVWQRWLDTMKWWLTFPGVRDWWYAKPTPFTTHFSELVNAFLESGYRPERPDAWNQWMRTGKLPAGKTSA